MPVVSIIIPCFNYGHLLAETLDSVLNQTFQDWEAIIVDDGSTDNTREVAEKYCGMDSKFHYFFQKNSGLSSARNNGIRQSSGKYLQFLDADDLLEPFKLEEQTKFLEKNPTTDLVYSETRFFDSQNPEVLLVNRKVPFDKSWMPFISGFGFKLVSALISDNIMVVHSPLVTKKMIESVGFFDERLKAWEDHEFWIRAAVQGFHFNFLDKKGTFALTRIHLSSMTGTKGYMASSYDLFRELMVKKILGIDPQGDFNKIRPENLKSNPEGHLILETVCLFHLRKYKTGKGFIYGLMAVFISRKPFYQFYKTLITWFKRTIFGKKSFSYCF